MADPIEFQFICKSFNVIHEYEINMDALLRPALYRHLRMW